MKKMKMYEIVQALQASDPEAQLAALDEAKSAFEEIAQAAVDALRRGPNRFLVAERLHGFGTALVPGLVGLLGEQADDEARTLAALVLRQLGSNAGVPVLLAAIDSHSEFAGLSASHLAEANVAGVAEAIARRLRHTGPQEVDLVVTLLLAWKKLGLVVPEDIQQRFSDEDVPWQIRSLLW